MPVDPNEDVVDHHAEPRRDDDVECARLSIRRTLPGRRLDSYLHGRFPRFSRTAIKHLIKAGIEPSQAGVMIEQLFGDVGAAKKDETS